MAPFIPIVVAIVAGITWLNASPRTSSKRTSAPTPKGYRRLREGDRVTANMVIAQERDIELPYGVHRLYDEGFMTGTEYPTGKAKRVVVFVETGSEYLR